MRIIAGEKKGFPLVAPKGELTRPTLGRVRESVFGMLGGQIIDSTVLDLFAGGGSLGWESLSRGATQCIFVENNAAAIRSLHQNRTRLSYGSAEAPIINQDVFRFLREAAPPQPYDVVFADPPYHRDMADKLLQAIDTNELFLCSTLVLQYGKRDEISYKPSRFSSTALRSYGETTVQFFASIPGDALG